MRRAKRSAHAFFRFKEELVPDIGPLLRGELELVRHTRIVALSPLTGEEHTVTSDELAVVSTLPSDDWVDASNLALEEDAFDRLATAGVVVTDDRAEPYASLRERDQRLTETGWSPHAALYHAYSKWHDVDVGEVPVPAPEALQRDVAPPRPFRELPNAHDVLDLPLVQREDGVFRVLEARRTTRAFDEETLLTVHELSLLLRYTFGCHGFLDVGDGVVVVKKTSPSGGSLHPVEVYPLVIRVDGIPVGFYHYRPDRHALELATPLEPGAARELLVEFAAGQAYLSTASVLFVMTARFERSFWKYRHPRAYAVLHMDAAHLSQTLYLLCAELGLGAFVSAAANAGNIEDLLGLDGFEEGVIAVCGCGRPAAERSPYDAEFQPYVPRQTTIE